MKRADIGSALFLYQFKYQSGTYTVLKWEIQIPLFGIIVKNIYICKNTFKTFIGFMNKKEEKETLLEKILGYAIAAVIVFFVCKCHFSDNDSKYDKKIAKTDAIITANKSASSI